jgi:hypothetical protein
VNLRTIERPFSDSRRSSALSRVRIFLALLALAGLATVLAACGGGGGGSSESPQAVLEGATFKGIESADLELKADVEASGKKSGNARVEVSGPFQSKGQGQLPELDMSAHVSGSVEGKAIDKELGLVLVPNQAFVSYEGEEYEVDPTTFSFIESAIDKANKGESTTEASAACQKAASQVDVADFIENPSNEGGADVGGTETTKISGNLDVPGAIGQVLKIAENPACSSSLQSAGSLPLARLDEAKTEVEKALKSAHVDLYVGEDKIVRRVTAEFSIEPEGAGEKVDVNLDLAFNGVNEEQEIEVPSGGKPLTALFQKLGVNPLELLQGIQSGKGLNLEGLLNGAVGGVSQGKVEECAKQASSANALRECIAG